MIYMYHVFFVLTIVFKVSNSFKGVFWHICDIHLNDSYTNSHQITGKFGNYFADSSLQLVMSAIDAMKTTYGNPDFIIWNGDNVAHMQMDNNSFLNIITNVTDVIKVRFPNTEILPSLGNHDTNNHSQMIENSTWCGNLSVLWKDFIKSQREIESFQRGCFYSRKVSLENEQRKVIVLNTIIWYTVNRANSNFNDPYGQFQWMKNELQEARKNNLKVFIVGHVPPGASEYSPKKYKHLHPQFNAQLVTILQNYSDIIEAGFFSHQHTDSFKIVYNSKGKAVIPLFLSPSVTPFHLSNLGSVNPSIRLYHWPSDSSKRYYEQYNTILPDTSSHASSLNWTLEYASNNTLPGLSAASMHDLLSDFASLNSRHFTEFFRRHLSGRNHDNNETCPTNSSCRCQMICGMKWISMSDLNQCLSRCKESVIIEEMRSSSVGPNVGQRISQVPMIVSVIVVFTLVLIATVVGVNKVYCHQRRSASLTRDIYMATYNGKNCEEIVEDHIDHIAEKTFGDVPEYRGHIRNNSRTILTLHDGNELVNEVKKSQPSVSKFAISKKDKPQEKYDYSRM